MSLSARGRLRIVGGICFLTAITACGGSSSAKSTTTTSPPASSTTSSTEIAAPNPEPATEPATDPIAAKAVLRLADLGSGFKAYSKSRKPGLTAIGAESCAALGAQAPLTTKDHVYDGPMFEETGGRFFVYSESYVFRTEALAKKFTAFRATPAYRQCKVKQDNTASAAALKGNYVKLNSTLFSDPTRRITTMYREIQGGLNTAGKKVDAAFYDRFTFRHGRVVLVLNVDGALPSTDAAQSAIAKDIDAVLGSVDTALNSRVAGV